ncbi:hypothetical protein HK098_003901 [Nowakowskiella sp. JEL0407]|nr:hypothetical protein HK098_003901 [Nowakowskiella sp. JEL0407]
MDSYVLYPHFAKYRVLRTWTDFPPISGLPFLALIAHEELILVGTLVYNRSMYGYFYSTNTNKFGYASLHLDLLVRTEEDPTRPNKFTESQPKEKRDKSTLTFLKGQQSYCSGELKYPEEVFNIMCPMYNYVNERDTDNLVYTELFEKLVKERLGRYSSEELKTWKVWNNLETQMDVVTPYFELKSRIPARFTNPMIFEMFAIFKEWKESNKNLNLLIQEKNGSAFNTQMGRLQLKIGNYITTFRRETQNILPALRRYEWVRSVYTPNSDYSRDIFSVPLSTSTSDHDIAVIFEWKIDEKNNVNITYAMLRDWGKTEHELIQVAINNIRTTTPLKLSRTQQVGIGSSSLRAHFYMLEYNDEYNAARLLLPNIFMPLSRTLNGDVVVMIGCKKDFAADTYICGANNHFSMQEMILMLAIGEAKLSDEETSRYWHYNPYKGEETPPRMFRPYRLKVTRIEGAEDDEWTMGIPFHSDLDYFRQLIDIAGPKDMKKALEWTLKIMKTMQKSEYDTAKLCKALKAMYPAAARIVQLHQPNDVMETFPFHYYLSSRYAKNCKYEWEPFQRAVKKMAPSPSLLFAR